MSFKKYLIIPLLSIIIIKPIISMENNLIPLLPNDIKDEIAKYLKFSDREDDQEFTSRILKVYQKENLEHKKETPKIIIEHREIPQPY